VKLNYYADTDSLYIDLSEQPSVESREISEGVVVDYDANGNLVGIDIDNASKKVQLQQLILNKLPVRGTNRCRLIGSRGVNVSGRSPEDQSPWPKVQARLRQRLPSSPSMSVGLLNLTWQRHRTGTRRSRYRRNTGSPQPSAVRAMAEED
jgi:uncharacterized protein YuzE